MHKVFASVVVAGLLPWSTWAASFNDYNSFSDTVLLERFDGSHGNWIDERNGQSGLIRNSYSVGGGIQNTGLGNGSQASCETGGCIFELAEPISADSYSLSVNFTGLLRFSAYTDNHEAINWIGVGDNPANTFALYGPLSGQSSYDPYPRSSDLRPSNVQERWNNLTVSFNKSDGEFDFYINGRELTEVSNTVPTGFDSSQLSKIQILTADGTSDAATIDDFEIMDRSLSAKEAKWMDNRFGELANHLLARDETASNERFFVGLRQDDFRGLFLDDEVKHVVTDEDVAARILAANYANEKLFNYDYDKAIEAIQENSEAAVQAQFIMPLLEGAEAAAKNAFILAATGKKANIKTVLSESVGDFTDILKDTGTDAILFFVGQTYLNESARLLAEVQGFTENVRSNGFDYDLTLGEIKAMAEKFDQARGYFKAGQTLFNDALGIDPEQGFFGRLYDRTIGVGGDIIDSVLSSEEYSHDEQVQTFLAAKEFIDQLDENSTEADVLDQITAFFEKISEVPSYAYSAANAFGNDEENSVQNLLFDVMKRKAGETGIFAGTYEKKEVTSEIGFDGTSSETINKDPDTPGSARVEQAINSYPDINDPALFLEQSSPVAVTFGVSTPNEDFEVSFETIFIEGSGVLSVFIDDILLAAFDSADFTLGEANILSFLVTDQRFFGLLTADLRFLWDEGEAGDLVQIDDITLTTVFNAAAPQVVPLPAPILLLLTSLGAIGVVSRTRRMAA
ncbi:hypothetical protein [Hwanghaeella sp.]|uniref:hypothetical protein n=1 Tax=Hwanghaeella sp. TaxID=2605943 RepID=UPI003CCC0070